MSKLHLDYVNAYRDRHGKPRYYFRRAGYKPVKLPPPGSPGFLAAYEAANTPIATAIEHDGHLIFLPGTLGWLIEKFLASQEFSERAENTKKANLRMFDELRELEIDGHRFASGHLRDMLPRHAKKLRNVMRERTSKLHGDLALNLLSVIWQWADKFLDLNNLPANPTAGIARLHVIKNPRQPWTDSVFAAFEAAAPGHLRLCVALCLYTGQRVSDVVQMKWSQFDGDWIRGIVQEKTGALVDIPCHRALKAIIAGAPRSQSDTILIGERGFSYTNASSPGAMLRRLFKSLGITGYSIHGLRKNAVKTLTELGLSPQDVQAITGHKTIAMTLAYGKQADQRKRARRAVDAWEAEGTTPVGDAGPITYKPLPKSRILQRSEVAEKG